MIVIASGQHGGQEVVGERWPSTAVKIRDHWRQVLEPGESVQSIFIGQRLPGLPDDPLTIVRQLEDLHPKRVIIWIADTERTLWQRAQSAWHDGRRIQLWVGPLNQRQLEQWIEEGLALSIAWKPARYWALYAVSGQLARLPLLSQLIRLSSGSFGSGTVLDLSWHDPQLSLSMQQLYPDAPKLGEPLLPVPTSFGQLIPAPPPWEFLTPWPSPDTIHSYKSRSGWVGMDMGSSLRNPLWPTVMQWVGQVLILGPNGRWEGLLRQMVEALRLIANEVAITVLIVPGPVEDWLSSLQLALDIEGLSGETLLSPEALAGKKEDDSWHFSKKIGIPSILSRLRGRRMRK